MLVKVIWPDGSEHHYETDHAGVNRLANHFSAMYVMGELELVHTVRVEESDGKS